jgi:hypothetical protein
VVEIDDGNIGAFRVVQHIDGMLAILESPDREVSVMGSEFLHLIMRDVLHRVRKSTCSASSSNDYIHRTSLTLSRCTKRFIQYMREDLSSLQESIVFKPCLEMTDTIKSYVASRFHSTGARPMFSFVKSSLMCAVTGAEE